jgi:hypothetical protein
MEKIKFRLSTRHHVAIAVCAALLILTVVMLLSLFDNVNPTPSFIRATDIYKLAFGKASASPAVKEAIGEPVGVGTSFSGDIEDGETSGKANFLVDVSSATGKGRLAVEAVKADGSWKLLRLDFTPRGASEPLNLLLEAQ